VQQLPELVPETPLTQFGDTFDRGFSRQPRPRDTDGLLSLIAGRLSIGEAKPLISSKPPVEGEAVRHTTVGRLTDAGFHVFRTPLPKNPDHVSVEYPGKWDDDVCEKFDSCFGVEEVLENR
jgi:hypothetical protein